MDKTGWRKGLEELQKDDITMVEVYQSYIDDLMMEFPEVTMPEARVIVRNAVNRAAVGNIVRSEIAYFMENGEFWKG